MQIKVMATAAQPDKIKPQDCFGHTCAGSWTNPEMIKIMRKESSKAMQKFISSHNLQVPKFKNGEVVVHYRCGDVINSNNAQYGLLPFSWYKQAIPEGTTMVYLIGNFHASRAIDKVTRSKYT